MIKRIDYQKELNPAQLEAVRSTDGQYLVIAGAGSGKTRILVYRVAYLVEKGIKPDEILLLTFTRKAAEEMLSRASMLLDERCQKVSGGTFHSFANNVLRRYAGLLGINNNFTILDRTDSEDAINLLRTQLGFSKLDKRFPRKRAIMEVISMSVNKSLPIEEALYDEYPQFIEWTDEINKINNEYKKYKHSKSLVDYDDLLVYLKELLVKHDSVRLTLAKKYKYIMVDEYQDTNKLQAFIVSLLACEHKNIMVVGDDSQSIYSFRGANFKNIMDFPKLFKDASVITLEENYRSTQPILNMTNQVIRLAKEKFEKNLYTKKEGGKLPLFIDTRDEFAQSKYIADKILELREEGVELGDIAVLFRSGWHSNDLEVELANRNLPFVKYGGQKFVEAAHIKDVISYLRLVQNPSDQISWYRALLLLKGIGPKTAERIIAEIAKNNTILEIDPKFTEKINGLKPLLGLLKDIDPLKHKPGEMIRVFLKYYQPLLKEKYDDFNKRLNDLDSLERIAFRYGTLEQFLTDMALEPPEKSIVEPGIKDKDDSSLTLSTIHSAKGLEWHTVFVIYLAEGHLPSYLSLEDEEAIEEERRLFYVALTRAKENLFLLKPHIDRSPRSYFDKAGSVFTTASRFLEEGGVLDKFVECVAPDKDNYDNLSLEDILEEKPESDQAFLEMLKEYYRE
ncbi:MAG: ATP-dependent helicase [Candidatus Omnitrophota bacterium]|nr:ATP-dependent helicase [Candidatus Omnitrophota bacterium]MBU1929518.1 ATP-dependent helicase [Candidatus Omnitrophota bacterium]MBU2035805.1 ATP-dependent helicase [Candidatus Omnitrophota bacterium]MBU2221793.1 ATP-dependent helicase [Candidatus Omnitrophota bacterium]